MDDAVYTFEQILHQNLEGQGADGFCKTIQRCQDRVIKVRQDWHCPTARVGTGKVARGKGTTCHMFLPQT